MSFTRACLECDIAHCDCSCHHSDSVRHVVPCCETEAIGARVRPRDPQELRTLVRAYLAALDAFTLADDEWADAVCIVMDNGAREPENTRLGNVVTLKASARREAKAVMIAALAALRKEMET